MDGTRCEGAKCKPLYDANCWSVQLRRRVIAPGCPLFVKLCIIPTVCQSKYTSHSTENNVCILQGELVVVVVVDSCKSTTSWRSRSTSSRIRALWQTPCSIKIAIKNALDRWCFCCCCCCCSIILSIQLWTLGFLPKLLSSSTDFLLSSCSVIHSTKNASEKNAPSASGSHSCVGAKHYTASGNGKACGSVDGIVVCVQICGDDLLQSRVKTSKSVHDFHARSRCRRRRRRRSSSSSPGFTTTLSFFIVHEETHNTI